LEIFMFNAFASGSVLLIGLAFGLAATAPKQDCCKA
jgi:hypothetical protein